MNYELFSIDNKDIHFEYYVYKLNDTNVILELYRGKIFSNIIKDFINKAIELFGMKIFNIKKSYQRT